MHMLMLVCLSAAVAGLGVCVLARARGVGGAVCVRARARDRQDQGAWHAPVGPPHGHERRVLWGFFRITLLHNTVYRNEGT